MPSEEQIRAEIRYIIEHHSENLPVPHENVGFGLSRVLTEDELKEKAARESAESPTHVSHLNFVNRTPYQDQVREIEAIPAEIEKNVQLAFELREMLQGLITPEMRKELLSLIGESQKMRRDLLGQHSLTPHEQLIVRVQEKLNVIWRGRGVVD